jgi:hypothetical protein
MKRKRAPPKTWRRNMVASVVFLVILDAVIISPGVDLTRVVFAAVVTAVVGLSVAKIWRSNTELEKAKPSPAG